MQRGGQQVSESDPLQTQIECEQALAGLENLAALLGGYFKKLIEEGFDREEALEIVIEHQSLIFTSHREDDTL